MLVQRQPHSLHTRIPTFSQQVGECHSEQVYRLCVNFRDKFHVAAAGACAVDGRVLEMRWKDSAARFQRHAAAPERVMVYSKRMWVRWTRVNARLQAVTGLDDVMLLDLQHFCRSAAPLPLQISWCFMRIRGKPTWQAVYML